MFSRMRYTTFAAASSLLVVVTVFAVLLHISAKSSSFTAHPKGLPVNSYMTTAGPSFSWNIQFPSPVLMDFQNTVNYQLNGTVADTQWAALMPTKGGVVYLGPEKRPFMLSTFHQLQCLDIIRRSYAQDMQAGHPNPTPQTRHCMNYLRQMVLCRGDTRLERVVDPLGPHAVQVRDPQTCRDWRSLYAQVERNTAGMVDHNL